MSRVRIRALRISVLSAAVLVVGLGGADATIATRNPAVAAQSTARVKITVRMVGGHAQSVVGHAAGARARTVVVRVQRRLRTGLRPVVTRRMRLTRTGRFSLSLRRYVRAGAWRVSAQLPGMRPAKVDWVERRKRRSAGTPSPAPAPGQSTPEPATTPSTRVLWAADPLKPLEDGWSSVSTLAHCNGAMTTASTVLSHFASEVDATGITGGRAFSSVVSSIDGTCPGDNQRSEFGQGNPGPDVNPRLFNEGQERWISFSLYLPPGFPTTPTTTDRSDPWQVIAQWKQLGALAEPVICMEVRDGQVGLFQSDTNDGNSDVARPLTDANGQDATVPAVTGRWMRFTLHVVFSPHASVGQIEWFSDAGSGLTRVWPTTPQPFATYTMKVDSAGATVPSHARIGLYRNKQIAGTAQALFGPYVVASTRAAAEEVAFR